MIYSRYTENPQELELEADQIGLAAITTLLFEGRGSVGTSVSTVLATPYDGYLERIEVETAEGLVSIARQGTALKIRGSRIPLTVLAQILISLIEGLQESPLSSIPYHLHIEHYPEHPYLDVNSAPLILFPVNEIQDDQVGLGTPPAG